MPEATFVVYDNTVGRETQGPHGCLGVLPATHRYLQAYAMWPARNPTQSLAIGDEVSGVRITVGQKVYLNCTVKRVE